MGQQNEDQSKATPIKVNEDWFAVIIAFILIVLSAIGLLGENGIVVSF
jgi:hypothetical protein